MARYDHPRRLKLDGNLDLIKAVVRAFKVRRGADLWVHSDAPPGSGLGSSSTLVVALIGVLSEWLGRPLTAYDMAELAYRIERVDLGLAGGRQDQYAAAFGGFNFIEFGADATVVNPLRIRADVLNELEYRLLLCYMGQTRRSERIIERQTASYRARHAVGGARAAPAQGRDARDEEGPAARQGGRAAASCCTRRGRRRSASTAASRTRTWTSSTGWRAGRAPSAARCPGAGGGGYFLLLTRFDRKHRVAAVLEKHGGQVVPFQFERRGLVTWSSGGR